MTALAAALRQAGLTGSQERLDRMAAAVLHTSNGNFEKAIDALWAAIRDDADALAAALHPHRHAALGAILRRAGGMVTPVGGGAGSSTAPNTGSPPPAGASTSIGAATAAISRSVLDTIQTDLGKPVGDCTRSELAAAAKRSRRFAWFFDAIAAPMPPVGVARDFWKPDDAAAEWARSAQANTVGMPS